MGVTCIWPSARPARTIERDKSSRAAQRGSRVRLLLPARPRCLSMLTLSRNRVKWLRVRISRKSRSDSDLEKFCKRKTQLPALFRKVRIRHWILTVPIHDSVQVNIHLAAQTEKVKGLELAYVAEDFVADIHDLQSFDGASRERQTLLRHSISLPSVAPSSERNPRMG